MTASTIRWAMRIALVALYGVASVQALVGVAALGAALITVIMA